MKGAPISVSSGPVSGQRIASPRDSPIGTSQVNNAGRLSPALALRSWAAAASSAAAVPAPAARTWRDRSGSATSVSSIPASGTGTGTGSVPGEGGGGGPAVLMGAGQMPRVRYTDALRGSGAGQGLGSGDPPPSPSPPPSRSPVTSTPPPRDPTSSLRRLRTDSSVDALFPRDGGGGRVAVSPYPEISNMAADIARLLVSPPTHSPVRPSPLPVPLSPSMRGRGDREGRGGRDRTGSASSASTDDREHWYSQDQGQGHGQGSAMHAIRSVSASGGAVAHAPRAHPPTARLDRTGSFKGNVNLAVIAEHDVRTDGNALAVGPVSPSSRGGPGPTSPSYSLASRHSPESVTSIDLEGLESSTGAPLPHPVHMGPPGMAKPMAQHQRTAAAQAKVLLPGHRINEGGTGSGTQKGAVPRFSPASTFHESQTPHILRGPVTSQTHTTSARGSSPSRQHLQFAAAAGGAKQEEGGGGGTSSLPGSRAPSVPASPHRVGVGGYWAQGVSMGSEYPSQYAHFPNQLQYPLPYPVRGYGRVGTTDPTPQQAQYALGMGMGMAMGMGGCVAGVPVGGGGYYVPTGHSPVWPTGIDLRMSPLPGLLAPVMLGGGGEVQGGGGGQAQYPPPQLQYPQPLHAVRYAQPHQHNHQQQQFQMAAPSMSLSMGMGLVGMGQQWMLAQSQAQANAAAAAVAALGSTPVPYHPGIGQGEMGTGMVDYDGDYAGHAHPGHVPSGDSRGPSRPLSPDAAAFSPHPITVPGPAKVLAQSQVPMQKGAVKASNAKDSASTKIATARGPGPAPVSSSAGGTGTGNGQKGKLQVSGLGKGAKEEGRHSGKQSSSGKQAAPVPAPPLVQTLTVPPGHGGQWKQVAAAATRLVDSGQFSAAIFTLRAILCTEQTSAEEGTSDPELWLILFRALVEGVSTVPYPSDLSHVLHLACTRVSTGSMEGILMRAMGVAAEAREWDFIGKAMALAMGSRAVLDREGDQESPSALSPASTVWTSVHARGLAKVLDRATGLFARHAAAHGGIDRLWMSFDSASASPLLHRAMCLLRDACPGVLIHSGLPGTDGAAAGAWCLSPAAVGLGSEDSSWAIAREPMAAAFPSWGKALIEVALAFLQRWCPRSSGLPTPSLSYPASAMALACTLNTLVPSVPSTWLDAVRLCDISALHRAQESVREALPAALRAGQLIAAPSKSQEGKLQGGQVALSRAHESLRLSLSAPDDRGFETGETWDCLRMLTMQGVGKPAFSAASSSVSSPAAGNDTSDADHYVALLAAAANLASFGHGMQAVATVDTHSYLQVESGLQPDFFVVQRSAADNTRGGRALSKDRGQSRVHIETASSALRASLWCTMLAGCAGRLEGYVTLACARHGGSGAGALAEALHRAASALQAGRASCLARALALSLEVNEQLTRADKACDGSHAQRWRILAYSLRCNLHLRYITEVTDQCRALDEMVTAAAAASSSTTDGAASLEQCSPPSALLSLHPSDAALLSQCLAVSSPSTLPSILLEIARFEEGIGLSSSIERYGDAVKALATGGAGSGSRSARASALDWRVWAAAAAAHLRCGQPIDALSVCERALKAMPESGRLWAAVAQVQLHVPHALLHQACPAVITGTGADDGLNSVEEPSESDHSPAACVDKSWRVVSRGLKLAPKSGELWIEAARLRMHPLGALLDCAGGPLFDLRAAGACLERAQAYTAQYGDGYAEGMRLAGILAMVSPPAGGEGGDRTSAQASMDALCALCVSSDPDYGPCWGAGCEWSTWGGARDRAVEVLPRLKRAVSAELRLSAGVYQAAYACACSGALDPSGARKARQELQDAMEAVCKAGNVGPGPRFACALPGVTALLFGTALSSAPIMDRVQAMYGGDPLFN